MTYAQLDARAGAVATFLCGGGVAAGAPVGLRVAPGGELLAALLGVLRAGAVAVPLVEPGLEDDALAGLPPLAAVLDAEAVAQATDGAAGDAATEDADHAAEVDPTSVALIVRTGGVGDGPRAIELTHATLLAAAQRQRDALRLAAADRVAHVPGRGAWSWALAPWAALAAGATVVGPERAPRPRSATPPRGWLEANAVTVAAMDPWLAGALLGAPGACRGRCGCCACRAPGPCASRRRLGGRGRLTVRARLWLARPAGSWVTSRAARRRREPSGRDDAAGRGLRAARARSATAISRPRASSGPSSWTTAAARSRPAISRAGAPTARSSCRPRGRRAALARRSGSRRSSTTSRPRSPAIRACRRRPPAGSRSARRSSPASCRGAAAAAARAARQVAPEHDDRLDPARRLRVRRRDPVARRTGSPTGARSRPRRPWRAALAGATTPSRAARPSASSQRPGSACSACAASARARQPLRAGRHADRRRRAVRARPRGRHPDRAGAT